jgi:hypothetical protein
MLLPGVVSRQVELAGAAGDADAAADAHQPVVAGQRLARLALQLVEAVVAAVDAADHCVERGLGDVRVAAVAHQLAAVALEFLQQVRLEVGTRGDVHDLEERGEREVVVHRQRRAAPAGPRRSNRCSSRSIVRMPSLNGYS